MGWFARRALEKKSKAEAMELEARNVMKTVESPYSGAKKCLAEYEKLLKFKPGPAYRKARKGYDMAVAEAEVAKVYTEACDLLESQKKMGPKKISGMNDDYLRSIATGKISKASKIASRMLVEANSCPVKCPVKVSVDEKEAGSGRIDVIVTNGSPVNLVINSITCSSGASETSLEKGMSEGLPPNASIVRRIDLDPDKSQEITVTVEYEGADGVSRTSKRIPVRRKVGS